MGWFIQSVSLLVVMTGTTFTFHSSPNIPLTSYADKNFDRDRLDIETLVDVLVPDVEHVDPGVSEDVLRAPLVFGA